MLYYNKTRIYNLVHILQTHKARDKTAPVQIPAQMAVLSLRILRKLRNVIKIFKQKKESSKGPCRQNDKIAKIISKSLSKNIKNM